MKTKYKRQKQKRLSTIRQRLIAIVLMVTAVSLISLVVVSYAALHSMEKNKTEATLKMTLKQMTEHMDEAYYSMVRITQQMKEGGTIGSLLVDFMSQKSAYYIYKTKRKLSDELIIVSFPNSSVNFVIGYSDEYLKLKISAVPIDNKANKELISYVSKLLNVPKSTLSLISGDKSKIKRILVKGKNIEYVAEKFSVYDKINE